MSVPVADLIAALDQSRPETLAALDARGFLLCGHDTIDTYKDRIQRIMAAGEDLRQQFEREGEVKLFDTFPVTARDAIPPSIMEEASRATWGLYRFAIDWVPGFFIGKGIGPLWGGCAATDPETFFTIFLIRHNFSRSERWFIYHRDELMSHELCHVARMVTDDRHFEEHFAYATAHSRLRRYMGNWFQTKWDALLFLLPVLVLLFAESLRTFAQLSYPIWPFWLLAMAYPAFLMFRNQMQRRVFFHAFIAVHATGCHCPAALLFRCNSQEIAEISRFSRREPTMLLELLRNKAKDSLKWQVMVYRFIDNRDDKTTPNDGSSHGDKNAGT